ncbi:MAG: hypothetical protein E7673_01200 [Ruminococcaceae bacterium]|nr:hypothetical protein [Oscillospiraceae bacterium]
MSDITRLLEKPYLSVGIFGVGTSNVGAINYLLKKNPTLRLTVRSDTTPDLSGLTNADRIFAGKDAFSNIGEEILLLSPSVRRDRKEIQAAASNGVLLSSDAELYFALTDKAPISVTGSDGKSTTTHLIAKAYSKSGINAVPCGNYGKSLCSTLGDNALQVAELSSFQLNFMKPHSKAAIITNITPNHLNWHTSFDEYVEAKMNVTDNAEKLIYDADSTVTVNALMNREAFAKTSLFLSYPKLRAIGGSENFITYENGIIYVNGSPYIDVSKAKRQEHYNVRNFMLTAASCIDACQEKCIEDALVNFTGLPHRAEVFFEDRGIKYIDSSIDSSPERTIKTLSALSDNTVAIIGGMGKGLS